LLILLRGRCRQANPLGDLPHRQASMIRYNWGARLFQLGPGRSKKRDWRCWKWGAGSCARLLLALRSKTGQWPRKPASTPPERTYCEPRTNSVRCFQ
jgi:hypothetical protein